MFRSPEGDRSVDTITYYRSQVDCILPFDLEMNAMQHPLLACLAAGLARPVTISVLAPPALL